MMFDTFSGEWNSLIHNPGIKRNLSVLFEHKHPLCKCALSVLLLADQNAERYLCIPT
jgi:hypothetical protein